MTVTPQSFKITHLSPVVDYLMPSQEKDSHVEHCFCPQTKIGEIVYYVLFRENRLENQLLESPL